MRNDMIVIGALVAAIGLTPAIGTAQAGDRGCRTVACFERVRQPDLYKTVHRPVVVAPGYTEVVRNAPVVMDRVRRVEVVPGQFNVTHAPAVYGSYSRAVMVAPARHVQQHVPAAHQTVHSQVVVRRASFKWQRTVDAHGRITMCKVEVPAMTRTVARTVQVSPAMTVMRTIPARYTQVQAPVLLQPARTQYTYQPAMHAYVSEPMVIRPATQTVIQHPPVIAMQRHEVLARRGGHAWVPVSRHH